MGIFFVTAQSGSAVAPWIAKALLRFHSSVPFFVMAIFPVIAFFVAFFVPETKGKILNDFVTDEDSEVESENNIRLSVEG